MKKLMTVSFVAALAAIMLLPVARQVNATSVNQTTLRQGTLPMPGSGGGHFTVRQGGVPIPGSGGGH
jgi:hypothetical protein